LCPIKKLCKLKFTVIVKTSLHTISLCLTVPEDFTLDDILRLKSSLIDFEQEIDKVDVPMNDKGLTKPGM